MSAGARLRRGLLAAVLAIATQPVAAEDGGTPVDARQILLMMVIDQGRSVGYQRLIAGIHLDTVKAELARDAAILRANEQLRARDAIPQIELEIAQLKDAWNRKQLIVAQKNLDALGAQFTAITEIAQRFVGEQVTVEELYASYRRSWDAGCDKGPDEVVAMRAWAAYAEKALERARELHGRGAVPLATVLEREAQLEIARSNYESREVRLPNCRAVLFPSLDEIKAVGRPGGDGRP